MFRRLFFWYVPIGAALMACAVFGAGFYSFVTGDTGEAVASAPRETRVAAPRAEVAPLVIGDSLARGTGDESGRGFAGVVLEGMRKRGRAELVNLGVNGMESPEIRAIAESANVRGLAANASLILVSAGANDLSHAAARPGAAPGAVADAISGSRRTYVENLRAILTALRTANPAAPIGVIGLYDPFGERIGAGRLGAEVIVQWNALAAETALSFPRVFVIPTFDLFQGREEPGRQELLVTLPVKD